MADESTQQAVNSAYTMAVEEVVRQFIDAVDAHKLPHNTWCQIHADLAAYKASEFLSALMELTAALREEEKE